MSQPTPITSAEEQKYWKSEARKKAREAALRIPITADDVIAQIPKLEYVRYGPGYCWAFLSKSYVSLKQDGKEYVRYGRFMYHGFPVLAHRFALALKLGCTLWELEGRQVLHASVDICTGGRCCDPSHLRKGGSTANAWDSAKDRYKVGRRQERTKEQRKQLLSLMLPDGFPTGESHKGEPVGFSHNYVTGPNYDRLNLGYKLTVI